MTKNTHQILCGVCEVAPEPIRDGHGEAQRWRCPVCGNIDDVETIRREARDYTQRVQVQAIQDKARDVSRKHPWIKFSGDELPKREHRWITRARSD